MKPFVLLDIDTMELILVIKNTVKRIKVSELDGAEDFIDEFYRHFKEMNFVPKYNIMNRKEFVDLVAGLKNMKKAEIVEEDLPLIEHKIIERNQILEEENTNENATLVRSNTDRKISIDDLQMRFDEPYDYYDLSVFDKERIDKSNQLKFFLDRKMLVMTTMDEITKIRGKLIAKKEQEKRERQENLIVNRKEVMGEEEGILISSDDYRNADTNMSGGMNSGNVSSEEMSEAKVAIADMFSSGVAVDGDESKSIDELLRRA